MENKRRLYGDATAIEKLLSQTQLMEAAEGGWASVHKEMNSNTYWLNCFATSAINGGGYQMLIRLPLPTTEELTSIAITSTYEDEAVAAILRLLDEEALAQKDFRGLLLSKLEKYNLESLSISEKKRFTTILKLAALEDPTNRRAIVGKTTDEVNQDALYFEAVSKRALKLLDRL
jgi:hypothetical protein